MNLKSNPYIVTMKKCLFTLGFTCIFAYCILFPTEASSAVSNGLTLWYRSVLPTLLPFSIFSYIIIHADLYHAFFSKRTTIRQTQKAFQSVLLYPLFFGFLCGFPIGAKLLADLYESGHLKTVRISLYAAACNHFGPAFLLVYVREVKLQGQIPAAVLLLSLYLPPLVLFALLLLTDKKHVQMQEWKTTGLKTAVSGLSADKKPASRSALSFQIIDAGIINGFETMLRIAGYIVLFSILAQAAAKFAGQYPSLLSLLTGILEVTSGVDRIAQGILALPAKTCVICGIVSFGGFCGLFQTKTILRNCPFKILPYAVLKLICATVSVVIACIGLQ